MSGDSISAELVDYLNDELSPARRAEIEALLSSDPERARELDEYKKAQQAFKKLRVRNVSSDFNIKVQERIARKVEELRARGSVRFRTARERVEAAREGLSAEEIKRRSRKALKLYVIAFLIALPVLVGGLIGRHYYFKEQDRRRRISEENRNLLREMAARQNARRGGFRTAVTEDGRLASLGFLAGKELRLVLHRGTGASERCVALYTPEQWRKFLARVASRRGEPDYGRLRAAADGAAAAKVPGGVLELPAAVHKEFLKSPASLEVLRLAARTELWTSAQLSDYLAGPAKAERRRARRRALEVSLPADGRLEGLGFLGSREVRLVPHSGPRPGERCVFVYDPGQWELYISEIEKRKGLRGYGSLRAAADKARKLKARGGKLYLPPELHQGFLGAPERVLVLRLAGRAEIWTAEDLEDYLSLTVRLVPPAPAPKPEKPAPPRRMRWTPE